MDVMDAFVTQFCAIRGSTDALIAHVELALEYVLEVKSTRSRSTKSRRAPCPVTPSKAVGECAAVRVFHPGMEVFVVLLAACLVARVPIDGERACVGVVVAEFAPSVSHV